MISFNATPASNISVNSPTVYVPAGRAATGVETKDLEASTLKPAEQATENQKLAEEERAKRRSEVEEAERIKQEEREAQRKKEALLKERLTEEAARLQSEQEQFAKDRRELDQRQARAELFNAGANKNLAVNLRLLDIGLASQESPIGGILNERA